MRYIVPAKIVERTQCHVQDGTFGSNEHSCQAVLNCFEVSAWICAAHLHRHPRTKKLNIISYRGLVYGLTMLQKCLWQHI